MRRQTPTFGNKGEGFYSGSKTPEQPVPTVEPIAFSPFKQKYLDTHGNGATGVEMHPNHGERTRGEMVPLHALTLAELRRHVNRREKSYKGKKLSPYTLKKEISSLSARKSDRGSSGQRGACR